MKKSALRYIIQIFQGRRPALRGADWYEILGFLELNRVAGAFYRRLCEQNLPVPQAVERRLRQICDQQSERNRLMGKWLADLSELLEFDRVNHAFLKGSILSHAGLGADGSAEPFYRAGERVSNDIDVLVEPKDIGRVSRILGEMGFVQGYYDYRMNAVVRLERAEILKRRMNRGETAPFLLKLGHPSLPFVEVDVNFSLDYLPSGSGALLRSMLANTCIYPVKGGAGLRSLRPVDFLIHMILHQYKEMLVYSMVIRNKDLELYKLLDLYLFFKRGIVREEELCSRLSQADMNKPAYLVLRAVNDVFEDLEIGGLLDRLRPGDLSYLRLVVDPERKNKLYRWENGVLERLALFDHSACLSEVKAPQ